MLNYEKSYFAEEDVEMERILPEKKYEYITGHLEYLNEKIIQSFTLFIKLAMAIIAGAFTLSWKIFDKIDCDYQSWAEGINCLFSIVSICMILLILDNLRSWRGYRETLSDEYGIKPISRSYYFSETVMVCLILLASFVFDFFNPLGRLNTWWVAPLIAVVITLFFWRLFFKMN